MIDCQSIFRFSSDQVRQTNSVFTVCNWWCKSDTYIKSNMNSSWNNLVPITWFTALLSVLMLPAFNFSAARNLKSAYWFWIFLAQVSSQFGTWSAYFSSNAITLSLSNRIAKCTRLYPNQIQFSLIVYLREIVCQDDNKASQ